MKRFELTNSEWELIYPILPKRKIGSRGRPSLNDRMMLNGILWINRTGAQWREMPECYGKWQAVYARFRKWDSEGVFEQVFRALSSNADKENLSIDSTSVKVHQSANGNKKGL